MFMFWAQKFIRVLRSENSFTRFLNTAVLFDQLEDVLRELL
jgi:hypothetical protein